MNTAPPPLAPDLATGLRRLKLAAIRRLAPELLVTAKTQRWTPEELLRTLIEAEITARDASNARARMRAATFPVHKTLSEFDRASSTIPAATFDYLASLEWIAAAYERRSLGVGSHWPFESWGRFLPEHTTAVSLLDRLLHHRHTVITDGDSYRMKQARAGLATRATAAAR